MKVNIHEAKTHFSQLVERATEGEEVIIAKAGKPVVRLVPVRRRAGSRVFGRDRGRFKVPDDFNAPLPKSILRGFAG